MGKLTKEEINVLAARVQSKLKEILNDKKEKFLKSYTPSENYLKCKDLIQETYQIEKQINQLETQLGKVATQIRKLSGSCCWNHFNQTSTLEQLKDKECTVTDPPSLKSIKDEIIFINIDSDFNANQFIENYISKLVK
jgi:uncharacterized protein (DUF3084 family)